MVIKNITKGLPIEYKIVYWESEDRYGKHKYYVPYYKNKPIFNQNTTFKTLTETRKKIKTHAENIQMRKSVKRMQQPKSTTTQKTVTLIGVGNVKAKKAENFNVGDTIVYNYGETARIKKVTTKGKSVYWKTLSKGKIYDVRKSKSTLVAYK
jgi:hypothetical protein